MKCDESGCMNTSQVIIYHSMTMMMGLPLYTDHVNMNEVNERFKIAFRVKNTTSVRPNTNSVLQQYSHESWNPLPCRPKEAMINLTPSIMRVYLSLIHISEPTRPY